MAILFEADGEDAGTTPWEFDSISNGGANTFALDANAKRDGLFGYRLTCGGDSGVCRGNKVFGAGYQTVYLGWHMRFPSAGRSLSTDDYLESQVLHSDKNDVVILYIYWNDVQKKFSIDVNMIDGFSTTLVYDGYGKHDFEQDKWYHLAVHYFSANPGGGRFWIDYKEKASNLTLDCDGEYAQKLYMGCHSQASGYWAAGNKIDYDNITIQTSPFVAPYGSLHEQHHQMGMNELFKRSIVNP